MGHNHNDETSFADGARVPVDDGRSGPDFLGAFAAEFPHISMAEAQEMLAFCDEHLPPRRLDKQADIAAETAEAMRRMLLYFAKVFSILINYQKSQSEAKFIRMSTCAMALALGFTDEAGAANPTELARVLGLGKLFGTSGKQAVHKCVDLFIKEKLKLPRLPGARSAEARQNITQARLNQLGGEPPQAINNH